LLVPLSPDPLNLVCRSSILSVPCLDGNVVTPPLSTTDSARTFSEYRLSFRHLGVFLVFISSDSPLSLSTQLLPFRSSPFSYFLSLNGMTREGLLTAHESSSELPVCLCFYLRSHFKFSFSMFRCFSCLTLLLLLSWLSTSPVQPHSLFLFLSLE
jgi:hypothetical protein